MSKKRLLPVPTKRGQAKQFQAEYESWINMMQRCFNPLTPGFKNYGGRGISVDKEWLTFGNFCRDMAGRPKGSSLERIDNGLGYSKANCRWASAKEQNVNTRRNRWVTYSGKTLTISQWSESLGLKQNTLLYRLRRGWDVEAALGFKEHVPASTKTLNGVSYHGRLNQKEIQKMLELRADGLTTIKLGEIFKIHHSQISRILKRFKNG